MIKTLIAEVLKERIRISIETQDNWDYGIEQCKEKCIDILSKDLNESFKYILDESSDEEFYWLSEIFEEFAGKTQSRKFIEVLRKRLSKVVAESYNQQDFQTEFMRKYVDYNEYVSDVGKEIDFAEGQINE